MKKCNSCGSLIPDDSRFCTECGSSDIVPVPVEPAVQPPVSEPVGQPYAAPLPSAQPAAQPYAAPQPTPQPTPQQPTYAAGGYQSAAPAGNGPQQGVYQQAPAANNTPTGGAYNGGNVPPAGAPYQQPGAYPYAAGQPNYAPAQPVKKKKKTGLIIAIVLGVLFIFGAIIVFIGARIAKKAMEEFDPNAYIDELISEFEDGFIESDTDEAAPAVAYTKGELVGNVYTNEWAGITFTLPEGFVNGSAEDYDDSSDTYTDACLIAEDEDNGISFITIATEDMTEDEYLNYVTEDMLDEEMTSQGWSFGTAYSMPIAGENYRALKMSNSNTDAFEEIIACRIYDGHILCFICYGNTPTVDAFFDSVTTP